MSKSLYNSSFAIGLAFLPSAALAATQEDLLTALLGNIQMYVLIIFVIIVIAAVYFMPRGKPRKTPRFWPPAKRKRHPEQDR